LNNDKALDKMKTKFAIFLIVLSFCSLFYHSLFSFGLSSLVGAIIKTLISTLTLSLVMSSIYRPKWRLFASIFFTLNFAALYFLALYYGRFTAGMLASIVETSPQEAQEYLFNLELAALLETSIISMLFGWACLNINNAPYKKSQCFLLIASTLLIAMPHLAAKGLKGTQVAEAQYRLPGEELALKMLAANANTLILAASYEYRALKTLENKHTDSQWQDVRKHKPSKDIYLIVLGESAIRDKFTLYGYSRPTTDKLESTNNITLVKDAIAPAAITRIAIPRLFYLNHADKLDYSLNIIDLANAAGFNTHWISNQGVMGNHDTPVSSIARKAHHRVFLNSDYELAKNDRQLATELNKIIQQQDNNQPSVIFLHTIGSHQDFCQRIDPLSKRLPLLASNQLTPQQECYDNSILNTYDLLMSFQQALAQSTHSYRMIYVADHALVPTSKAPYYLHGTGNRIAKTAFEVPLIFFEDSPVNKNIIHDSYFLTDFPHTFADWLGVSASKLNPQLSILNPDFDSTLQKKVIIDDKFTIRSYQGLRPR
jgi:glucan phosphoethanolaminetransferase (alkaline phosphatase superfamily)